MLRFDKPKLEGPVAVIAGSALGGWLGAGTAVGAIGGSIIGGLAASALTGGMSPKVPSFPTSTLPGAPSPTQLPGASGLPISGQGSPATTTDLAKGELETMKRRGRVSTILSRQNAGVEEVERLGG